MTEVTFTWNEGGCTALALRSLVGWVVEVTMPGLPPQRVTVTEVTERHSAPFATFLHVQRDGVVSAFDLSEVERIHIV